MLRPTHEHCIFDDIYLAHEKAQNRDKRALTRKTISANMRLLIEKIRLRIWTSEYAYSQDNIGEDAASHPK